MSKGKHSEAEMIGALKQLVAWRVEYNELRPHSSLGYRTPREFATWMGAAEDGMQPPSSAAKAKAEATDVVV